MTTIEDYEWPSGPFREVTFGRPGVDYLRSYLANGGTLSKLLASKIDLEHGQLFTYLPSDVSQEQAERFADGGKIYGGPFKKGNGVIMQPVGSNLHLTVPHVVAAASEVGGHFVAEDVSLRKSNLNKGKRQFRYAHTFQDEVYHVGPSGRVDAETVRAVLKDSMSYREMGIVARSSLNPEILEISAGEMDELAGSSVLIMISVYDGEGSLVWIRSR